MKKSPGWSLSGRRCGGGPSSQVFLRLPLRFHGNQPTRLDELVQDYLSLVRGWYGCSWSPMAAPQSGDAVCPRNPSRHSPRTASRSNWTRLDQLGLVRAPSPQLPACAGESGAQREGRDAPGRDPHIPGGDGRPRRCSWPWGIPASAFPRSASPRFLSRCIRRNREARGWDSISCRRWWPRMAGRWAWGVPSAQGTTFTITLPLVGP